MTRRPVRRRALRPAMSAALALALLTGGAVASADAQPLDAAETTSSTEASGSVLRTKAFTKDVSKAPLHPNSRAMVQNLDHQVTSRYGGVAAFNAYKYNVSLATASSSQKRVDVRFTDCQRKGYTPKSLYGPQGHFEDVPIPADAIPAGGSDGQLTVYSPSEDRLWEFWKAQKTSSGWSACWGGRVDKASQSQGYFPDGMGASASGLAVSQGAVRVQEAQARRIDHALTLAIPTIGHWKDWSYPAQRSDGSDKSSSAIPMGTRFRLDPSLDVESLHLHPVAEAIAVAVQKYGFIVSDRSGAVAVSAESGDAVQAKTGKNPWKATLGGTPSYSVMEGFPWDRLQALPEDWGKPS